MKCFVGALNTDILKNYINATTVAIILIMISKWHGRMENKLNDIQMYIQHVTDRNDIVYINQLESLKRELIKAERYEDVEKISKCIEREYDYLKRKMEDREQIINPLK